MLRCMPSPLSLSCAKDRYGNPIEDFEEHHLRLLLSEPREVKEWYAIAQYLQSFGEWMGAEIPAKYRKLKEGKL